MAQSQILSLDDEELEVLMDLRYRATVCTRRRTRLHQETRFINVGHQVLLGLSGQELDPASFYGVVGSMLRRMEALNEELISRMAEEEQDRRRLNGCGEVPTHDTCSPRPSMIPPKCHLQ